MAHAVLQNHIAKLKESIRATRNLKNREACLEKGRREKALKDIEADRRRVKVRCEKEKEARQSTPENAWGGGVSGDRTGDASQRSSSGSSGSTDSTDDEF
jgi:hypothetical protein